MRRTVLLSSLAVGRCFTQVVEPGGSTEESGAKAKKTMPILAKADAWKITEHGEHAVEALNAAGESRSFEPGLKVVEIPRQGYDKLVAQ